MTIEYEHVDGKDRFDIKLYALSTCVWCKKTKRLLDEMGVAYDYVYVDKLVGDEKDEVMDEVEKYNPRCSFPTTVIDEEKCIIGYKKDKIKEEIDDE